jgi:hypothetical protein
MKSGVYTNNRVNECNADLSATTGMRTNKKSSAHVRCPTDHQYWHVILVAKAALGSQLRLD